jgi:cation:H+ antiporter
LQLEVTKQLFIVPGVNHGVVGDCASCCRDRLAISMNDYATLILGVVCAGIGGELFVRGAVGLAHWTRVSPGVIGATVAAFATSSSELSVSISAAIAEKPQIALGDALGSNVVNVALILALAVLISRIPMPA